MTTNNPIADAAPVSTAPPPEAGAVTVPAQPKPKREFSTKEQALLGAALGIAVLADRLLAEPITWNQFHLPFFAGIFWLAYLAIFTLFYWEKIKKNTVLWMVTGFSAALCVWNFLYDYYSSYGVVTWIVIPAVLMAHAVYARGGFGLKQVGVMVKEWFAGWFVRPFSAIPMMVGAASSLTAGGKRPVIRKVALGLGCVIPLMLLLIPLLGSADQVFGYYLQQALGEFEPASFVFHCIVVIAATGLFYSFLWNIGFAQRKETAKAQSKAVQIDVIVSCMVLGSVTLLYLLFCAVQFTYLFAGAGLPGSMTYSEYAREGFAQIIAICAINLLLFGIFLQYGVRKKVVVALLSSLLALTGVMLVSGFVRLRLYIVTYGMTWLRLLSAWFIVYLAAVLILCVVRMVKAQLPLIAVSALMLLGWYTALGYANPDALILQYNLRESESTEVWVERNHGYFYSLSDNAVLSFLESEPSEEALDTVKSRLRAQGGYSLSSYRLRVALEQNPTVERLRGDLVDEYHN